MSSSPTKKARTGESPLRNIGTPTVPILPEALLVDEASSPLLDYHPSTTQVIQPSSSSHLNAASAMLANPREAARSLPTLQYPGATSKSSSTIISDNTSGSLLYSTDMSTAASSVSLDTPGTQSGLHTLQGLGVHELLENDRRPTFLVDLEASANLSQPGLPIVYSNAALRAIQERYPLLLSGQDDSTRHDEFPRFKSWVMSSPHLHENVGLQSSSKEYGDIVWVSTTVRSRYRFISGSIRGRLAAGGPSSQQDNEDQELLETNDPPIEPSLPVIPSDKEVDDPGYFGHSALKQLYTLLSESDGPSTNGPPHPHPDAFADEVLNLMPSKPTYDWFSIPMSDDLPEHLQLIKRVDWASTPLGPVGEWDPYLRAATNLVMGSPHPAALYWGPELVCFYNAAYIGLAGNKHPQLLGSKFLEAWAEVKDEIYPTFKHAQETGQATLFQDRRLFISRNGYPEEGFFSGATVPLLGQSGEVLGIYTPCFENTRRHLSERRMAMLQDIGEQTATATSVSQFWPHVQNGLDYNEVDVPFCIIYSVKNDEPNLHSGSPPHAHQLVLEGSTGVPQGHPSTPFTLDLQTSNEGFAPFMRQSISMSGVPVVLSVDSGTLPAHLTEDFQWRGFGDPCRTIVVIPVIPTTTVEAVAGFVIIGMNPRRPYDDEYQTFVRLFSRQLDTSMASVVLLEQEIRRSRHAARLAALDHQELSEQLWQRTQEASELENKLTRMTEVAPVGMFIADGQGRINYCNDRWWEISGYPRSGDLGHGWMDSVKSEDRPRLDATWQRLLEEEATVSVEFRFNYSQMHGSNTIDTWVLMSAYPERDIDGKLMSIFGCITDISSQKWAEKLESKRREEAVEHKRQQENFIDITSHEMRNPLSAILQCVDQVTDSISTFSAHADMAEVDSLLMSCLDAINTIDLCASHQKRIIDDILTLSKLDSNLLIVSPVDEQPIRVVSRTLKMFEPELNAHDIELEFHVDDSFEKHDAKWVRLDPSRLQQVLINLMTNAIKLTQGRDKRTIAVSMYAARDISESTRRGTRYLDRNENHLTASIDIKDREAWGHGERISIHCSVEDTGPGLGEHELKVLLQQFEQTKMRTHVEYGGSGLGLFISRILVEMQGGQMGVSCGQQGSGSKFSFYVQGRKCLNPPAESEFVTPFKIVHAPSSPTAQGRGAATAPLQATPKTPLRKQPDVPGEASYDVLIVEDNIVNQKVLQRQLNNCGHNTHVANHGREALQTLQRSRFWLGQEASGADISVILMDLEMPVMDGITCAKRIRELEREGTIITHIPIIAVTAYARPEQIETAKAAGIDDVISKPFRIPELIPKIQELVTKFRRLSATTPIMIPRNSF